MQVMCCVVVEISVLEFPSAAAEAATAVLRTAAAVEAAAAAAATTTETGSAVPVAAAASEVAVAAIARRRWRGPQRRWPEMPSEKHRAHLLPKRVGQGPDAVGGGGHHAGLGHLL